MQYKIIAAISAILLVFMQSISIATQLPPSETGVALTCNPGKNVPLDTTVTCSVGAIAEQNVNDVFNDLHIKVHDPMGNEILTKDIGNWTDNGLMIQVAI